MKKENILNMTDTERQELLTVAAKRRQERINSKIAQIAACKVRRNERLTVEEFENLTGIMFSHNMSGKMDGILSLSTNVFGNPHCIKRLLSGVGICAECFAAATESQYSGLFENTAFNTLILSSQVLDPAVIPAIDPAAHPELRIESFGDAATWEQAANYLQFAIYNPGVQVTAWTKNPWLYAEAIAKGYAKPHNFTLILSSFELNKRIAVPAEYKNIIDKTFTVYTLGWLLENGLDYRFINCGGRSCKNCQRCYRGCAHSGDDIRELLKSDAKKAAEIWPEFNTDEAVNLQDTSDIIKAYRIA